MSNRIAGIEPGSISEQLGILPGDILLTVNGEKVIDWIDYQAFCCQEQLVIVVARENEEIEFSLEKDEYEPLGLQFDSRLMSPVRNCANHCIFCFVDQLPANTRDSLRVKDDDWRLSLMMGNFVTLTNVTDKELDRIIARKASPLYISVHATDGALRSRLLGTPRGAHLMSQLNRLKSAGIRFHAQAVLCPGINDGNVLRDTVNELAALYPACLSLALVPVGLTGHRDGLCPLKKFDQSGALAVVQAVNAWQQKFMKKLGTSFVFASDEFYLAAGCAVPADESYEDYPQIENGVGLMRMLETEFCWAYEDAALDTARPARLAIATGVSAAPFLRTLMQKYPVPDVQVTVYALENHFFGTSVTVAGLLTGGDLISQMKNVNADKILITECMLRDGEDVFLDDMPLADVQSALGLPIVKVGRRGDELLDAIMFG